MRIARVLTRLNLGGPARQTLASELVSLLRTGGVLGADKLGDGTVTGVRRVLTLRVGEREKILSYRTELDAVVVPMYLGEIRSSHRNDTLTDLLQRRISDFTDFDKFIGPLLDGSAFGPETGYVGPRAGELPARVQETFRNQGRDDLPLQYRDWIDSYYRRLNRAR